MKVHNRQDSWNYFASQTLASPTSQVHLWGKDLSISEPLGMEWLAWHLVFIKLNSPTQTAHDRPR